MDVKLRHGIETGLFGVWLTDYLKNSVGYKEFQVSYDHGDKTVNANVIATKGFFGEQVSNLNRLTDVDVVVVDQDDNIHLLIEIEERNSSPKKFLGDVMALLLCNRLAARRDNGQHYLSITSETKLIVAGVMPDKGYRLTKVEKVILPRIQSMKGLPDSLDPAKVDLQFSNSIETTIERLQDTIRKLFP